MREMSALEVLTALLAGATIAAAVIIVRKDLKDTDRED